MYKIALAVFSLCAATMSAAEQEMDECCEQVVLEEILLPLEDEVVDGEVVFEADECNEEVVVVVEEEKEEDL
jgi:hypothetical protein